MKTKNYIYLLLATLLCTLQACKTSTTAVSGSPTSTQQHSENSPKQQLQFVQKVADNQLYQKNIVADLSFNLVAGSKDITVPGSLHMRKDEVIRLQLFVPFLGTEVGRLEFTPEYVLVIDRLHKEYIKADYTQLDFLKDNGLSFYNLQALFWNQLTLPGMQRVGENDLQQFTTDLTSGSQTVPVSYQKSPVSYTWKANRESGLIEETNVQYDSKTHGRSELTWNYSNFKALGSKKFPARQSFTFTTNATSKRQTATVTLDMSQPTTDSNWEATSSVSSKYKQIEATDIFEKITNL